MSNGMTLQVDIYRCATCFCCLFWFIATCVFAGVFGWSYSEWVSDVPFSYEDACRLTYTDDALISEKEMRKWAGMEGWTLEHPRYDVSKKACVCSSGSDPSSPSGDTPAWIAPGDLVSLYKDSLPSEFVSKYKDAFSSDDHVSVCIDQERLTRLWNTGHCHYSENGTLKTVFTGWNGALYCGPPCSYSFCSQNPNGNCVYQNNPYICVGAGIGSCSTCYSWTCISSTAPYDKSEDLHTCLEKSQ